MSVARIGPQSPRERQAEAVAAQALENLADLRLEESGWDSPHLRRLARALRLEVAPPALQEEPATVLEFPPPGAS